jgi:hypothetical protein
MKTLKKHKLNKTLKCLNSNEINSIVYKLCNHKFVNSNPMKNMMSCTVLTFDSIFSERVGAAKSVHLRRVFTINVFNLTIN